MDEIKIGDRVRSFDFAHSRKSFVEGIVTGFLGREEGEGCRRYVIAVDRQVCGGDEITGIYMRDVAHPPVNGTMSMSGPTKFVERIEDDGIELPY